jgi:2-dehydropantoate 2-reductase
LTNIVEKTLALIDSYPYESTSSLTRDVMQGRSSEIEYQNGAVVRMGRQYGVDVPVNRFIYYCILPMELAARAKANS